MSVIDSYAKSIKGFRGEYKVTRDGKVWSEKRQMFMKIVNVKGYAKVTLRLNGRAYTKMVGRLVAEAFIDNPRGFYFVKHIDGDIFNNHVDNLVWSASHLKKGE